MASFNIQTYKLIKYVENFNKTMKEKKNRNPKTTNRHRRLVPINVFDY